MGKKKSFKKLGILNSIQGLSNKKKIVAAVASVLLLFLITLGIYSVVYSKKVYLNQYVGDQNMGGKTKAEVNKLIDAKASDFNISPFELKLSGQDKIYKIEPGEIGLNYDYEKTTASIWSYGRNNNFLSAFFEQVLSLFRNREQGAVYTLNEEALKQKVGQIATELDKPEKDYSLIYKNGKFELATDQAEGERIDQEKIISNIKSQISEIKKNQYSFTLDKYKPQVTEKKANESLVKANAVLKQGDIVLKYDNQEFNADTDMVGSFINSKTNGDSLDLILNSDRIKIFITSIAASVNVEPQNAKLTVVNGQVTVIGASKTGQTLDEESARIAIENIILARINGNTENSSVPIALKVTTKKPDISENDIASAGIVELVGTDFTNFKGSPVNRVHNITTGANALNGVLLKPGEEFSTLDHLGKIDDSNGYLPELVIKDNSTVPEFGGGLCQVSSTLFRAAMKAGMQITERQNHKYRVSYYEPPVGMDATIYDPAPDFKFINTYKNYVLIQSKIEGTKITFEIYGTKDNRKVEISDPVVYDIVSAGPPVYIETDTLPAGETKRTEKAHDGASASFTYKVTSAAGEVMQEKTFKSKYIPWQEKWLVGKGTNVPVTCSNGVQDGDETGVDIGGSCPKQS